MNRYSIRPGHTFRLPDGSTKGAGDTIELPSDVAATHAAALEPCAEPAETHGDEPSAELPAG